MLGQEIIPHYWKTKVNCMIYVDSMLLVNQYKIEIGFDTSTDNPILHDVAFEKIDIFFNILMNNCIIMNKNDYKQKTFNFLNNIIELDEMLNDQALGSVLYSKLVSCVGDHLDMQYLKISSTLGKNIFYTINGVSPELNVFLIPKEEWWGNKDIKFDPWWLRSDTATYDEIIETDKLYEGEFSWEEHFKEDIDNAKELENKPKSKFKIINGGKDETK